MDTHSIAGIIEITMGSVALVVAAIEYFRNKTNRQIKTLAKEVIAFYYVEQEALQEISSHTGENIKTIQKRIRKKAENNVDNEDFLRPSMSPSAAKKYM